MKVDFFLWLKKTVVYTIQNHLTQRTVQTQLVYLKLDFDPITTSFPIDSLLSVIIITPPAWKIYRDEISRILILIL